MVYQGGHGSIADAQRISQLMQMVNQGASFPEIATRLGYSTPEGARRAARRLLTKTDVIRGASTRQFGVEIECFGVDSSIVADALTAAGVRTRSEEYNHTVRSHWKIVTDSSVSGNGLEVVSPILQGEEGLATVVKVLATLRENGLRVDKSCGLHVHLDMNRETVESIVSFAGAYVELQDSLDMIVAPSRRGRVNDYCRPATLSESREGLESGYGDRFRKFNVMSYRRYGTVEIRHHNGTLSGLKVTSWIRLMLAMADYFCAGNPAPPSLAGTLEVLVKGGYLDYSTRDVLITRARNFGFTDSRIGSPDDRAPVDTPLPPPTGGAREYASSGPADSDPWSLAGTSTPPAERRPSTPDSAGMCTCPDCTRHLVRRTVRYPTAASPVF